LREEVREKNSSIRSERERDCKRCNYRGGETIPKKILAIVVRSNHVHIVAEYIDVPIGVITGYYKTAGRVALQKNGLAGKAWTRGFDKQFCFSEKELRARVDYVNKHEKKRA
jgi:REP element-mobilizing transposase RayT